MATDPLNLDEETARKAVDYLGAEAPLALAEKGQLSIPTATGQIAAPAPAGGGGLAGGGASAATGGGPSDAALAQQAGGAALKTGEFLKDVLGSAPERGNVGGEGQIQRSDQSFSDVLRSQAGGAAGAAAGAAAGFPGGGTGVGTIGGVSAPLPMGSLGDVLGFPGVPDEVITGLMDKLGGNLGIGASELQELLGARAAFEGAAGPVSGVTAPSAVSGGSGLAGGLGTAGLGAGAAAALLGLIASLTGNKDLGTAASGVGGAATGLGAGSALAGAGTGAMGAIQGANLAGAGIGAAANAGIGAAGGGFSGGLSAAAAPAAVVLAPLVLTMLIDKLTGGDMIGDALKKSQGDYPTFVPGLMEDVGQQGTAFDTLGQALPYVQNKAELGQLLNSYRNYLGTTTGITPENFGSIEGADPSIYSVGKIPGVGPVTHGQQTPTIDWGPQTQALMEQVSQLYGVLPGDPITAAYGQPGGGLEGEPARRLWEQFMVGEGHPQFVGGRTAPLPYTLGETNPSGQPTPGSALPVYAGAGQPYQTFAPDDVRNAINAGTFSRTPVWDPETGQWVIASPGATPPQPSAFFQQSPYWQMIQAGLTPAEAAQAVATLGGNSGLGVFSAGGVDPNLERAA